MHIYSLVLEDNFAWLCMYASSEGKFVYADSSKPLIFS